MAESYLEEAEKQKKIKSGIEAIKNEQWVTP